VNIITNPISSTVFHIMLFFHDLGFEEWWAYVKVTPGDNNILLFSNGISGLTAYIPDDGHCASNSTLEQLV
jgi:hypothetical protein